MSHVSERFHSAVGKPNPETACGVTFRAGTVAARAWRINQPPVGAGHFLNHFLYLFGPRWTSSTAVWQRGRFLLHRRIPIA